MRLRSPIIVLLVIAIVGLALFVVATPKAAAPVTARLVKVAEMEETKRVTVEFLNHDAAARFAETHQVQVRIAGRWQPPLALPKFEDGYLLARTNSQQLVFDFPRQANACRFSLGYRVGPRPCVLEIPAGTHHKIAGTNAWAGRVSFQYRRQWPPASVNSGVARAH